MKATKWQLFIKVQFKSVMPYFFSGLKIAVTYSITGAVIAEWIGAEKGLGIFMTRAISSFNTDVLFADISIIILLSIILFKIVDNLGKFLMPWINY